MSSRSDGLSPSESIFTRPLHEGNSRNEVVGAEYNMLSADHLTCTIESRAIPAERRVNIQAAHHFAWAARGLGVLTNKARRIEGNIKPPHQVGQRATEVREHQRHVGVCVEQS